MERIFQDDEGTVDGLAGAVIGEAWAVADVADGNVILLWLEDSTSGAWLRIFIDGTYCGIDRYPGLEIEDDLDDGYIAVDYSSWFAALQLERAEVAPSGTSADRHIVLTMAFGRRATATLDCRAADGRCDLYLDP